MQIFRGETDVPPELRPYCFLAPRLRRTRQPRDFSDVELALVEVSSATELNYRGYSLHQFGINQNLIRPHFWAIPAQRRLANLWVKGLRAFDEDTRAKNAQALIEALPAETPNAELLRSILDETRSAPADSAAGLTALRSKLSCPIGLVIRHFRYMPDGRPVSWPPDFVETLRTTAQRLNIPVFDPAPMVAAAGVEEAIGDETDHYRESYRPIMGEALTNFALSVAG